MSRINRDFDGPSFQEGGATRRERERQGGSRGVTRDDSLVARASVHFHTVGCWRSCWPRACSAVINSTDR